VPGFDLPYGQLRHAKALQFIFDYIKNIEVENIVFFEEDWKLLFDVNVDELTPFLNDNISQIRFFRKYGYDIDEIYGEISMVNNATYMFSWNPCIFSKNIAFLDYPIEYDHELLFGQMLQKKFLVYKNGIDVIEHVGYESIEKNMVWDKEYNYSFK
jgi:hypothetical protein